VARETRWHASNVTERRLLDSAAIASATAASDASVAPVRSSPDARDASRGSARSVDSSLALGSVSRTTSR
jgi:hypothetical protein